MIPTINKLIISALLLIAASSMAFAQAVSAVPDATIIINTTEYDVQTDGRLHG